MIMKIHENMWVTSFGFQKYGYLPSRGIAAATSTPLHHVAQSRESSSDVRSLALQNLFISSRLTRLTPKIHGSLPSYLMGNTKFMPLINTLILFTVGKLWQLIIFYHIYIYIYRWENMIVHIYYSIYIYIIYITLAQVIFLIIFSHL